jgi:hypothetical protein
MLLVHCHLSGTVVITFGVISCSIFLGRAGDGADNESLVKVRKLGFRDGKHHTHEAHTLNFSLILLSISGRGLLQPEDVKKHWSIGVQSGDA